MVFALPLARFDGVRVLPFAFLAACSRRWRRAQRRPVLRQRAQRAAVAGGRAALEDTPDASAARPGSGAGRRVLDLGWLVGSRPVTPSKTPKNQEISE